MSEIAAHATALSLKEDLLELKNEEVDLSPKNDQLRDIYRDPASAGAFGGVDRLYKAARSKGIKTSRRQVERYLSSEPSHTILKPARRRFLHRQTEAFEAGFLWEVKQLIDFLLSLHN